MKTMKAIFKTKNGKPKLVDIPVPEPKEDEVLIKVEYAGICKTDLKVASGSLVCRDGGVVLGHEFSGTIVKCGADIPKEWLRKKVVANPMLDDHSDAMLGKDANGCFAEYVAVDFNNIYEIPQQLCRNMKLAAYCEPMAAACGAIEAIPDYCGEVVIAGDPNDRIAKLVKKCYELNQDDEISISSPEKLVLDSTINPECEKPGCIIECCPEMAGHLLKCLSIGGTLVLKSRGYVKLEGVIVNDVVMRELSIVGAKYSSFNSTLDNIAYWKDDLKPMILEKTFNLRDFKEAFRIASRKNSRKVMFKCAQ